MKPLVVLMSSSLPNETASATQQVMTAHALARAGLDVTLIAKSTEEASTPDDVLAWYGLPRDERLRIHLTHVHPGRQKNRIFFAKVALSTEWRSAHLALLTREPRAVPLNRLKRSPAPIVFEAHEPADVPDRRLNWRSRKLQERALRSARGIVTVSRGGAAGFLERGVDPGRLAVIPNGAGPLELVPMRDLPSGEVRLVYVGSLWADRGVRVLVEALALTDPRVTLTVVGESTSSRREEVAELGRSLDLRDRLVVRPVVPHAEVPDILRGADILILPMTGSTVGRAFASPMKLFEYMAAGRPIVASDLPTIREIVGDREVWFFEPENPAALAAQITAVLNDWSEARRRAEAARSSLESSYSWGARARALISFMSQLGILEGSDPLAASRPEGDKR